MANTPKQQKTTLTPNFVPPKNKPRKPKNTRNLRRIFSHTLIASLILLGLFLGLGILVTGITLAAMNIFSPVGLALTGIALLGFKASLAPALLLTVDIITYCVLAPLATVATVIVGGALGCCCMWIANKVCCSNRIKAKRKGDELEMAFIPGGNLSPDRSGSEAREEDVIVLASSPPVDLSSTRINTSEKSSLNSSLSQTLMGKRTLSRRASGFHPHQAITHSSPTPGASGLNASV